MTNNEVLTGKFRFNYLGRTTAPFEVELTGEKSLQKQFSKYLMSQGIDWEYDIEENIGSVYVGMFRKVGEFFKILTPAEQTGETE